MCGNVATVHVGQLLYESEGGVGCYESVGARVRNERVGVERKNGEGVCGAEERKTVRGYRREECGTEGGRGQ